MIKTIISRVIPVLLMALLFQGCVAPLTGRLKESRALPDTYKGATDSTNSARRSYKDFFSDPFLQQLIDTALNHNQELNIMLQEISMAKSEVLAAKGEYLPFLGLRAGAGAEKPGRYTRNGAVESNLPVAPGREFPEPLPDLFLTANVSWEIDIWKKLRNAKRSAMLRYLSGVEGRNFMVTNLVSEIANAYYELLALDKQLEFLDQNISIQQNALQIVKLEKESAKVTELAVKRFEAEVLKNQSRRSYILQQITETENRINFLTGRFPQTVKRSPQPITEITPLAVYEGLPAQLLSNRADIREAEKQLAAAKLDVKAARARFYPSLALNAAAGYQAFNAAFLFQTPTSLLYSFAGELMAPLINRTAIRANYYKAGAKQIQAIYHYEQKVLNAFIEVSNQLSNVNNIGNSYELKLRQVEALNESINISTGLFKSARADYMEVLLTQRDALDARFELVETKMLQLKAQVALYRALGGGWQ